MKFKAVLLDLVGTTVKERPNTIIGAFERAFNDNNVDVDDAFLRAHRGRGKKEIVESLAATRGIPENITLKIYDDFRQNIESDIAGFSPADGVLGVFSYIKSRDIRLGIGTGLPRTIFNLMVKQLGWEGIEFDYVGIAEEVGTGRPSPDMIIQMMNKLGIADKNELLKVGDTQADIREGKNAGVKTAVVLSGTQDSDMLRKEHPDYILNSLEDIKAIMK
jgi:phosphonatase-like hydrolase